MELKQSFIYTISRGRFTLCEQRILLRIVQYSQSFVKNLWIKDNLRKIPISDENHKISFRCVDVLPNGNKHYEDVREAIISLSSKRISFIDPVTRRWWLSPLVYNCEVAAGICSFFVSNNLLSAICDFTKGFSSFNLEAALGLSSPYAVRLYCMFASASSLVTFSIASLRAMFELENEYKQNTDFIKKVLQPASDELKKKNLNGFEYKPMKTGRAYTHVIFKPVRRENNKAALLSQLPVSAVVKRDLSLILINKFSFSSRELSSHKQLLEDFGKLADWVDILLRLHERWLTGSYKKGYVIAALRSAVAERKQ